MYVSGHKTSRDKERNKKTLKKENNEKDKKIKKEKEEERSVFEKTEQKSELLRDVSNNDKKIMHLFQKKELRTL